MFKEIKQRLLDNPDSIINILEFYEFYQPRILHNEIRCGLYEGSNPTAIRIKLINNNNLFVTDYSRSMCYDIINYIIKAKGIDFKDVMNVIKSELDIDDYYDLSVNKSVFGGFYNHISKQQSELYVKTYTEDVLKQYDIGYNKRFALDNISLQTQKAFNIGYDVISQRITIPIRNQYGEIIGIKGRANWNVAEDESKYLYLIPCPMSTTLYGLSQNYIYLQNGDIYIFESEKSVCQCHTYSIYNAVAIGSNSLSIMQCKLLMQLQPKRIIFMLDKTLDLKNTFINIERLRAYMTMQDTKVMYWDWHKSLLPDKSSPSDYGKYELQNIINNELEEYCYEERLDCDY